MNDTTSSQVTLCRKELTLQLIRALYFRKFRRTRVVDVVMMKTTCLNTIGAYSSIRVVEEKGTCLEFDKQVDFMT